RGRRHFALLRTMVQTNSTVVQLSRETGIALEKLNQMSKRERGLVKARHMKRLRQRAQEAGIDPDAFLAMTEDERQRALSDADADSEEAHGDEGIADDDSGNDSDEGAPPVSADGIPDLRLRASSPLPVYTDAPDVPPDEPDPLRRQGVTVGPIRETERAPDLVGERKPRTLTDLYARWPV